MSAKSFSGAPGGSLAVAPGTYSARLTFSDGRSMSRTFVVRQDPDTHWTQADYEAVRAVYGVPQSGRSAR